METTKLAELKTATKIVKVILQENPFARDCDEYLYYKVCEKINPECTQLPFWQVVLGRKKLGLPAFETVRRTRQKLQATYPELAGDKNVEAQRMLNEEDFREYARGGV